MVELNVPRTRLSEKETLENLLSSFSEKKGSKLEKEQYNRIATAESGPCLLLMLAIKNKNKVKIMAYCLCSI
jgi:hypothetical protein